jgi:DMSO/TMAO reductase YedYZ molybdopterin-dependent catalytic subunit
VTLLWDGIRVRDLLAEAGLDPGAKTVRFYASDGYTTMFPLSYIMDNNVMIAYAMNNVTLPPERGYPFQLVAEGKWGYKWIKWITRIEVSEDVLLSGYWEDRGYSASGDLNRSFLS